MLEMSREQRKLILFVDDDPSLLRLGRLSLERAGYRFQGALGGREGLLQARQSHPDLILLDYMMPDLSGKEVLLELLDSEDVALRNTPVIMLTARKQERDIVEALELGASDYIVKPFIPEELVARLGRLLGTPQ